MTYPRKIMSIQELHKECGFPKLYLYDACRHKRAGEFVVKAPLNGRGKYLIDTEKFEQVKEGLNHEEG